MCRQVEYCGNKVLTGLLGHDNCHIIALDRPETEALLIKVRDSAINKLQQQLISSQEKTFREQAHSAFGCAALQ